MVRALGNTSLRQRAKEEEGEEGGAGGQVESGGWEMCQGRRTQGSQAFGHPVNLSTEYWPGISSRRSMTKLRVPKIRLLSEGKAKGHTVFVSKICGYHTYHGIHIGMSGLPSRIQYPALFEVWSRSVMTGRQNRCQRKAPMADLSIRAPEPSALHLITV